MPNTYIKLNTYAIYANACIMPLTHMLYATTLNTCIKLNTYATHHSLNTYVMPITHMLYPLTNLNTYAIVTLMLITEGNDGNRRQIQLKNAYSCSFA